MIPVGKKRWRIFTLSRKTNAIRFRSIVTRHLLRNKNRILHMCNTSLWSIYWIRHCSTDKSFANNRLNTELGFKKRHRFQNQRFCVCSACIFEWNGNSGKSHSFNLEHAAFLLRFLMFGMMIEESIAFKIYLTSLVN